MKTAEGLAVVEFHAAAGHVQSVKRYGESLAEILSEGKIERGVLRQLVPWIRVPGKGITEAGTIVNVR